MSSHENTNSSSFDGHNHRLSTEKIEQSIRKMSCNRGHFFLVTIKFENADARLNGKPSLIP